MTETFFWSRLLNVFLVGLGDWILFFSLLSLLGIKSTRLRGLFCFATVIHSVLAFFFLSPFSLIYFHCRFFLHSTPSPQAVDDVWHGFATQMDAYVLAGWGAIVVFLLATRLLHARKAYRLLDTLVELQEPGHEEVHAEVNALCGRLGMRRPRLLFLEGDIATPFAAGFFRPLVVLPERTLTLLTRDELRSVLAHELLHIRRGDLFLNACLEIVRTLFFFSFPLGRLMARMREEIEMLRDGEAATLVGESAPLASSLSKVQDAMRCRLSLSAVHAVSTLVPARDRLTRRRLERLQARRGLSALFLAQLALFALLCPVFFYRDSSAANAVRVESHVDQPRRPHRRKLLLRLYPNSLLEKLAFHAERKDD